MPMSTTTYTRSITEQSLASHKRRPVQLVWLLAAMASMLLTGALTAGSAVAQEDCTCFGLQPTNGCRVNGEIGPCIGTNADDRIKGTKGNDVIITLGGDDRVRGLSGDDLICTGAGEDRVSGSKGNDRMNGGDGDDNLRGGRGDDELFGGNDDDRLRAGSGDDILSGEADADDLHGGSGDDTCVDDDSLRSCLTVVTALPASCGDGVLAAGEACETDTDCDLAAGETCNASCACELTVTDAFGFANGCYAIEAVDPATGTSKFMRRAGPNYVFTADLLVDAVSMYMKPADLGVYLFRDADDGHLSSTGAVIRREENLQSDITLIDDSFQSRAEWTLEPSCATPGEFHLRSVRDKTYISPASLTSEVVNAYDIVLHERFDCAEFPELTVDATGTVVPNTWGDGSVFGFVDTHSHILSNFAFGGGGIFHGAPFHRLGVEHAMTDCSAFHGVDGRQDLFGFGFDEGDNIDPDILFDLFINAETPGFNHATAGYPDFTQWPSGHFSSTHQTQYYKWLERAWLSGLRLVVQHATTNQIICDFLKGRGVQPVRYECNDMVAVDRIIDETYNMERYIDAQAGGPGLGFFRIVTTPQQARDVINAGKMAVILGIETANIFDCFLVPPPGFATCDEATVVAKLDEYYARGVRALFPVHKYDNGFSAGDGDKVFIELGNFINSGHYNNFTTDCDSSIPTVFDKGGLGFPGINMPRVDYFAPPPYDLSGFGDNPIGTLFDFLPALSEPAVGGDYCQNAGLTPLGGFLVDEMMKRGMILEIDHLPRRSYGAVFDTLEAADYPASGSHGLNNSGALYALGGVSKTGFNRCGDPATPGTMVQRLTDRVDLITANGGYPAEGFGFDLNGFAGAPGPRFGPEAVCGSPQANPITYPFTSYAGDVTFEEPSVANRTLDFNTEGLVHIGMVAELIEDVRRDGATDTELEPLFRSAEGYIRMWKKAEAHAASLP